MNNGCMPKIVLATLNASFGHSSLALRYLKANLGELGDEAEIREYVIAQRPIDIAAALLKGSPKIIGLGVYIWNVVQTSHVLSLLKKISPKTKLVVGGPEVSYEKNHPIVAKADYVVAGEGEEGFRRLCEQLLKGSQPLQRWIPEIQPNVNELTLPYHLYTESDIAHRAIYVEASRGCPYKCEFCLSSIAKKVRQFDLERFLAEMQTLMDRGVRQFKFIDRTFNLNIKVANKILQFFLDRADLGLFVHFEMVPDRFPDELREIVSKFPAGSLQFEVGVQTFDPETGKRISRRLDETALIRNMNFLIDETNVHVHADLIAGLPGEDFATFASGFDKLVATKPQEIQVGILKRLHGTPIIRHETEWALVFDEEPPYEVLHTKTMSFAELRKVKRFARLWDLVANSGNFRDSYSLIWQEGRPFSEFMTFTEWLEGEVGAFHKIALGRLAQLLLNYLVEQKGMDEAKVGPLIAADYARPGRNLPKALAVFVKSVPQSAAPEATPKRQARHLRS